jgi:dTDP-4-amino-4,6-dideoxygalactose transaminase
VIPFNKPFVSGNEAVNIQRVIEDGKFSAGGEYSSLCEIFFQQRWGFNKTLLTNSCTSALEMAALLLGIGSDDEIIMPAYTFVSTANAFLLRGAKVLFADSSAASPNMEVEQIKPLISSRTRAIVIVHYGGIACDMDPIMALASMYGIAVVEDAAHAHDAYYKGKPLGSFGQLAAFSFHETKNITAGEAGLLVINDESFVQKAEILHDKGTNRASFIRGQVAKYEWMDIGSSFAPSEITAAFLFAQLEMIETVTVKRRQLVTWYYDRLTTLARKGCYRLPEIPNYSSGNGHIVYLLCRSKSERDGLIDFLKSKQIQASFHYQALHESPFFSRYYDGVKLPQAMLYSDCLVRLPVYYLMTKGEVNQVADVIEQFYHQLMP